MFCTRTAQETAEDAVQIFGGRGITKTGMGRLIEHVCYFFSHLSSLFKSNFFVS